MADWITQNWLASYGALVGTIALVLNFARYRHSIWATRVRLNLSFEKHDSYDESLNDYEAITTDFDKERYGQKLFKLYQVSVQNIGNVEAHIHDVGVITSQKVRKGALKSAQSDSNIISAISDLPNEAIKPKSSAKYVVYLRQDEELYMAQKAYVMDKNGNEWLAKKMI